MRRIISGLFITLDGIVESPEQWNPPFYNDEMTEEVQSQLADCDTHLYGRRTYELFQSVFTGPGSEHIPHAPLMTETPKVLVSTRLTEPTWGPTSVINNNVAARIAELKQQPGKNINIGASGTLVRFLLQERLLDELNLLVHPVVVGQGRRLFEEGTRKTHLRLADAKSLTTGVVRLRYTPED